MIGQNESTHACLLKANTFLSFCCHLFCSIGFSRNKLVYVRILFYIFQWHWHELRGKNGAGWASKSMNSMRAISCMERSLRQAIKPSAQLHVYLPKRLGVFKLHLKLSLGYLYRQGRRMRLVGPSIFTLLWSSELDKNKKCCYFNTGIDDAALTWFNAFILQGYLYSSGEAFYENLWDIGVLGLNCDVFHPFNLQ